MNNRTGLASLLVLPLIGMLGLYLAEAAHLLAALSDGSDELPGLPPIEMIMVIVMVAMVPVFLLVLKWTSASRWVALVIVALMVLFHVLHIVEHAMMADVVVSIWIALSSALPNAIALRGIWGDKPE